MNSRSAFARAFTLKNAIIGVLVCAIAAALTTSALAYRVEADWRLYFLAAFVVYVVLYGIGLAAVARELARKRIKRDRAKRENKNRGT